MGAVESKNDKARSGSLGYTEKSAMDSPRRGRWTIIPAPNPSTTEAFRLVDAQSDSHYAIGRAEAIDLKRAPFPRGLRASLLKYLRTDDPDGVLFSDSDLEAIREALETLDP